MANDTVLDFRKSWNRLVKASQLRSGTHIHDVRGQLDFKRIESD